VSCRRTTGELCGPGRHRREGRAPPVHATFTFSPCLVGPPAGCPLYLRLVLGRRVIQRAGWSFADQALNSGTNFALSVVIARNVGAAEFGAFGLVFSCYLLAVGFTRAVAGEPLLVRASVGDADERLRRPAPHS